MIASYDDLSPEALAGYGFDDPAQASHILQSMGGHDVPDAAFNAFLRVVTAALEGSADPGRAVANLGRWADAAGNRASAYGLLASQPAAAQMLVTVFAASQFFADLIIYNPEYLEVLTNPAIRDRERDFSALWADLSRRVSIAKTPNARRDALRRFKPPEILRIGVRDLLGFADMPTTARAISQFADACVRMALQICAEERGLTNPPFAAIAMGKLGGQELNYASDIDLIFVHGDDFPTNEALKLAESVRDTLAKATDAGFVFRVDLRLRPEGRFGPVSRSLSSCRAYYESWAEPWERQALLKARGIAGDPAVGDAFTAMTQAFAYRARIEESVVESIRQNKRRLEQKIAGEGEADVNVKEGVGGIRDIEFAVQLLQLIACGANPALRTGNTLEALDTLAAAGLLTGDERGALAESYTFLRTVEHRLQIMDELPVRSLPREPSALRKFGRRLGYADGESFRADYRRHTARVHTLFRRLFYGDGKELSDTMPETDPMAQWVLATDDPAAQAGLRTALAERGFHDLDGILEMLRRDVAGSEYGGITPEARTAFAQVARPLLDAAAETQDPDAALRGIDALAQAMPSRAALYRTLAESPQLLPRLCQLAGDSPFLWQTLLQHLELFDLITDGEAMEISPISLGRADTTPILAGRLVRARLQIGARDLWGLADTPQTLATLTAMAEQALAAALEMTGKQIPLAGRFAVIGLGKLGGAELGYGSDLDVLYVAEPDELTAATRLAERVQHILKDDLGPYGFRYDIDARLRPEGRQGALVLDIESYRRYYETSALTWERQALLKARPVGGESALGQEFMAAVTPFVYGAPPTDVEIDEIRAMKRRIENERLKNPHDLKLGPGGLADIEWTTQLLQLQHGPKRPRLRAPNTLLALRQLRDEALIAQADWELLSGTYTRLVQFRNRLFLQTGVSTDAPAILPGDLQAQMHSTHALCLRLFYGET